MEESTVLDLSTGGYRFRPTEALQDYQDGFFSTDQFEGHMYTVVDPTDDPVLEVEHDPPEKLSTDSPLYVFYVPNEDPAFRIEEDHAGSHEITNARSGEQVGSASPPALIFGNWQLLDTDETVRATLTRDTILKHELPFTDPGSYTLSTGTGEELATVETDKHWTEIDVSVSRRELPVAVTLAFVFSVFVLRGGDSSYGV